MLVMTNDNDMDNDEDNKDCKYKHSNNPTQTTSTHKDNKKYHQIIMAMMEGKGKRKTMFNKE